MAMRTPQWLALSREAGLAAEHIAIGVTALNYANYAHPAYYYQAFFALSIGFERSGKVAVVVDHAIRHDGRFPEERAVRRFGHRIADLLATMDAVSERYRTQESSYSLPSSDIHRGIVSVLDDFASNVTRYYNIDVLTGAKTGEADSIAAWQTHVVDPVATKHYSPRQRQRDSMNAAALTSLIGGHSRAMYFTETGQELTSIYEASQRTGQNRRVAPYVRMYVLQIARFVSHVMWDLTQAAYRNRVETVPHLSDFFRIYNNSDSYFRSRKTWSAHRS